MSIINNKYFKGEIYIPHAKPSITDNVSQVGTELSNFILKYEKDCLVKCLGYNLAIEFIEQLDSTKANGLKVDADEKWNELLNGKKGYIDSSGNTRNWEGIRRKLDLVGDDYDSSFIANYIYFYYEKSDHITRSGIGNQRNKSKNAESEMPNDKVIRAWREFVKIVQGEEVGPTVVNTNYGFGIDWFNQNSQVVSLYDFINEMNSLIEDTYPNFTPRVWKSKNQFGI